MGSHISQFIATWITSILQFLQYWDESSIFDLQFPINILLSSLFDLFILFYIGQKLRSDLADSIDKIYATEWHRYPCSVRRHVLLMILRAQKPFTITACWCIPMNLEAYVGVRSLNINSQWNIDRIQSFSLLFRWWRASIRPSQYSGVSNECWRTGRTYSGQRFFYQF